MNDHVAVAVLLEVVKPEMMDEVAERWLHVGPEPRRTKIEAVTRWFTGGVDRQNSAAQAFAGLKKLEFDTGSMEETSGGQAS
ncbi:N-acyl-L-homoserine lactone synthetase [Sinorhizobium kostiense]|uniref:N-acyl-L-homoserine lactone synthetase n=1 Tax=Sinorhizobium kostiense TaxID=76747 RepID=A0ABS4R0Y4_9HYPH|nr:N-acyl-L-homoserine lactone synthetase [Sinorhizobium kostiense]